MNTLLQRLQTTYLNGGNNNGIQSSQLATIRAKYGNNKMTPPPTRSEICKFIDQITSGFAILLWLGGLLCFISFGLRRGNSDVKYSFIQLVIFGYSFMPCSSNFRYIWLFSGEKIFRTYGII